MCVWFAVTSGPSVGYLSCREEGYGSRALGLGFEIQVGVPEH